MASVQSRDSPPSPLTPTQQLRSDPPEGRDDISVVELDDRTVPVAPASTPLLWHSASITDPELPKQETYQQSVPHGWPMQPRQLRRDWRSLVVLLFLDVLFALISLAFLMYGFMVLGHRGQSVEEHQWVASALLNVVALGPTIFPIVFAAVVGRTLKTILVWLLERGEKLGTLDLLAGSNTVASTIWSLYVLRSFGFVGLALVAAWALSPVGGQASLRVVSLGDATIPEIVPLRYMSANNSYSNYVSGDLGAVRPSLFGMFNAALLGPERTKASPADPWNNVKVPMLEELSTNKDSSNQDWIDIPDDHVTYASLIGLPIADLPNHAETGLTMESFYWKVDCTNLTEALQPFRAALVNGAATNTSRGWLG
ncbi:hypothetical protein CLAFUW4_12327 [Fulvia fulva]|uniref:Uncharacterized protein n=1 Tax=Passalora fulva TaxID=5499 RepID=A0A9Q8PDS1_PASFU|nr:uncharacterized protein CLAFUR5_11357 [Fulvia fulva]KAK4617641.1 hypothetical protein CLAFUR4_12332 [Fulvia fulva]KAK4618372.1 hypothetical protein CLAFUR0_12343 [Fulvia fulva]UJO20567.1 hypothetical protein CLAFUR5_11357 [Fulvia fulva]WPV18267.1 hypothetical protein CLAFUW4_12327 [Fulvia fulva]WPV33206.1 hypothetical protein CLAFUW7_12334 [Fulvia fulva]